MNMKFYYYFISFFLLFPGLCLGAASHSVPKFASISLNKHELVVGGIVKTYDVAMYKNLIINRPRDLLVDNLKAVSQFYKAFPDDSRGIAELEKKRGMSWGEDEYKAVLNYACNEGPKYVITQTLRRPLWTLTECTGSSNACILSRLESNARDAFEQDIARTALEQYKQEEKINKSSAMINYVDVGSGQLFQATRALTLLLESGIPRIQVHLIDPLYCNYIKRKQGKVRLPEILGTEIEYLLHEERFKQFAHWFKQAYPDRNVRIFIYDSIDDYIACTEQNPALLANIYAGSDLDFSFGKSSIHAELAGTPSGLKEVSYMKGFDEPIIRTPEGLISYSCIPHEKILKPHGVGMLLYKGFLPNTSALQHCIKTLAKDEIPGSKSAIIFTPTVTTLQTRYMIAEKSYDEPKAAIIKSKL